MSAAPDIVVQAWTPRFAAAFAHVERIEGGYVNDPADHGGATKYGVSLRFLVAQGRVDLDEDGRADFDLDGDGRITAADVAKLSRGDAESLFHRCFWVPAGCESLPVPLGEAVFDQAVNGSVRGALRLLQAAIGRVGTAKLPLDGVFGPRSRTALIGALARAGMPALLAAYRLAAADRYRAIAARDASQRRFLSGWLARAGQLGTP